jgi:hypothetical protein
MVGVTLAAAGLAASGAMVRPSSDSKGAIASKSLEVSLDIIVLLQFLVWTSLGWLAHL